MGDLGASLFFPCSLFDVTPEIFCFYPQNLCTHNLWKDKRHILMSVVT